ncbi:MAG: hypothetical protein ABI203_10290, partial [Mucilaginibacter sp.]
MKYSTFSRILGIVILVAMLCLAISCDKVTQAPDNRKKLLFKEIFATGNTLYFSYDAKNRLTQCAGKDLNGIDRKCRFEYDDNNRLVRAFDDYSGSGQLTFTFNYLSANAIKLTLTSPGLYPVDWLLSLDEKGRLIKTDLGYNSTEAGLPLVYYTAYGYDAAGNVSKVDHTHDNLAPEIDTYLYDDKKTPFYNVVGRSSLFPLVF